MKRINILYVFAVIVLLGILFLSKRFDKHTAMFYGFAENKELEINLDKKVHINSILVTPGQSITAGYSMVEVIRKSLKI